VTPEDEQLLARVPPERRAENGVPDPGVAQARERAVVLATEALDALLLPGGVRTSPLGAAWSRDLDLHVTRLPAEGTLEGKGWIPMDHLFTSLGYPGRGRWAVVEDGRALGCAEFHSNPPPDPLSSLIERCRRRGEVRLREVLELRSLARAGRALPNHPVVAVAARIEKGLGGDDLSRWATGPSLPAPTALRRPAIRRAIGRVRSLARPGVVVAISGVDGAGKSTVAQAVAGDLHQLGVPVGVVWTRPGMRLGWLEKAARAGKRLLGQDPAPGLSQVAAGSGVTPASRRGPLGWVWSLLVALSFVADVRRRHRAVRGVAICDRHLLDALVTMDFVYRGVDLRMHKALIQRLLPRATHSFLLDLSPADALARKDDPLFGEYAVEEQLKRYARHREEIRDLHVLDATQPVELLSHQILRAVARG
jgi:thymidylate kinase